MSRPFAFILWGTVHTITQIIKDISITEAKAFTLTSRFTDDVLSIIKTLWTGFH